MHNFDKLMIVNASLHYLKGILQFFPFANFMFRVTLLTFNNSKICSIYPTIIFRLVKTLKIIFPKYLANRSKIGFKKNQFRLFKKRFSFFECRYFSSSNASVSVNYPIVLNMKIILI